MVTFIGVLILLDLRLGSTRPGASPGGSVIVIGGSPLLNKPAPEVDLTALDGSRVRLSDYRGRPVVLNFWASWCVPCRDEFPQFVDAESRYAGKGLAILGVIHQDASDAARAFAAEQKADWPMLQDTQDSAWNTYGSIGVPMTFFIDREGIVRAVSYGPVSATTLPAQLATIL